MSTWRCVWHRADGSLVPASGTSQDPIAFPKTPGPYPSHAQPGGGPPPQGSCPSWCHVWRPRSSFSQHDSPSHPLPLGWSPYSPWHLHKLSPQPADLEKEIPDWMPPTAHPNVAARHLRTTDRRTLASLPGSFLCSSFCLRGPQGVPHHHISPISASRPLHSPFREGEGALPPVGSDNSN